MRKIISAVLFLILLGNHTSFAAKVIPGSTCKRVNQQKIHKGKVFKCIKLGKKLYWDNGVPLASNKDTMQTLTPTPQPSNSLPTKPSPTRSAAQEAKATSEPTQLPSPSPRVSKTVLPTASPSSSSSVNPFSDIQKRAEAEILERQKKEEEAKRAAELAAESRRLQEAKRVIEELEEALCNRRNNCQVGKEGPGGGLIFYQAFSPQKWGTFIEVRYTGLKAYWCDKPTLPLSKSIADASLRSTVGIEIGKGKQNTLLMLSVCKDGAGVVASEFRGGGKDDWHLPSLKELDAICKFGNASLDSVLQTDSIDCFQNNRTGLKPSVYFPSGGDYWSSSEYLGVEPEGNFAHTIRLWTGLRFGTDKKTFLPVLAVRYFGEKK